MVSQRFLARSVLGLSLGVLAAAVGACGAPASSDGDQIAGAAGSNASAGAGNAVSASGASSVAGATSGFSGASSAAGSGAAGAPAHGGAANSGGAGGSMGAGCAGVPPWMPGTTASEVSHGGERYQCKVAGWCVSMAAAYEPGVGYAWQDAWADQGACGNTGGGGSSSAGATGAAGSMGSAGAFATSGDVTAKKREVAGFFANVARETGMLMYIDQIYKDPANGSYWGRGPLQLTWNYNYDACGKAIGADLLGTPTLVSSDGAITWQTALWFWMTNDGGTGKTPHTAIVSGNFGGTINAINGGLECKGPNEGANERIDHYKTFTAALGVDPGTSLTCW